MVLQLWIVSKYSTVLKATLLEHLLDLMDTQEAIVQLQTHRFMMVKPGVYKYILLKMSLYQIW